MEPLLEVKTQKRRGSLYSYNYYTTSGGFSLIEDEVADCLYRAARASNEGDLIVRMTREEFEKAKEAIGK